MTAPSSVSAQTIGVSSRGLRFGGVAETDQAPAASRAMYSAG